MGVTDQSKVEKMRHNSGGRGRKVNYESKVMRVPAPLQGQIQNLINDFHNQHQVVVPSNIKRLPASLVSDWVNSWQPIDDYNGDNYVARNRCYLLERDDWSEEYFVDKEEKAMQTWLSLSDEINTVLWQIDNSVFCEDLDSDNHSPYKILKKLIEYNLIYIDQHVDRPATPLELFELGKTNPQCNWANSSSDLQNTLIEFGFVNRRWDILAALEIGHKAPIDRKEYWIKHYTSKLGTPDQDYWSWTNPEVKDIHADLTLLLTLPEPSADVKLVLEKLPIGINPFDKSKSYAQYVIFNVMKIPAFYDWSNERRTAIKKAFVSWHNQILKIIDKETLKSIYQTCYKISWHLIEEIVNVQINLNGNHWDVLGVDPSSSIADIKKAYKNLAMIYHPDINPNGAAIMVKINAAYEQACKAKSVKI